MPTAIPFTALVRGNGFPLCLAKVDVSEYDNWITLGGVSSGLASSAQINESLKNCMQLHWNLHSATASFTATWADNSFSFDKSLPNHEYIITPEPKGRSCRFITPQISRTDMTEAEFIETDGFGCSTRGTFRINPVRMYNGSTSNELVFVGYGVSMLFDGVAQSGHAEGLNDVVSRILISSYLNGQSRSGSIQDPPGSGNVDFFDDTASILTIDNIPFRSLSKALAFSNAGSGYSKNISSNSRSASASGTFGSGAGFSSSTSSVTIPESFFDFYTYN